MSIFTKNGAIIEQAEIDRKIVLKIFLKSMKKPKKFE